MAKSFPVRSATLVSGDDTGKYDPFFSVDSTREYRTTVAVQSFQKFEDEPQ